MSIRRMVGLALIGALVALALIACGGSAQPSAPAYDPAVTPLTGIDAENIGGIENADGQTPCGTFNVNGFGPKVATLSAFPACTAASYTVLCLNDKAEWIGDNISEVKVAAGTVTFTSAQEGSCGLFAAP